LFVNFERPLSLDGSVLKPFKLVRRFQVELAVELSSVWPSFLFLFASVLQSPGGRVRVNNKMRILNSFLIILCFGSLLLLEAQQQSNGLKVDVISKPKDCSLKSKNGDFLSMHYTGTLTNGKKFDSR
jgi:hypothetical protein